MKNSFTSNQKRSYVNNNSIQRNSSNSINQRQTQLTYSLKPKRYINIPKDVVPYKIFQKMLHNSQKFFPSMPKIVNLKLSEQDNRSKIVYQIKNFVEKNNLNITTYFFSVYLMDQLLAKKVNLSFEKLGLGSILLGTKFLEIDGKLPSMESYLKYTLNRRISSKEIIEIENICLKQLDHNLNLPQPINFLNIFLLNGIVFNTDESDNKKKNITSSIYMKPYDILSELISLNADYLQYHPLDLACACVAFSRESYKLSKWHFVFENNLGIHENKFIDAYNFVKNFNEEKKKIIEKNEILRKERNKKEKEKEIENEKNKNKNDILMYHNSSSTSNILLNNSRRLVTSVSYNRNGFENNSKIIYFKNKMQDFEDKNNLIKRKEQRSLETQIKKIRENSITFFDTAENSDLSLSLKSYNKNNTNNNTRRNINGNNNDFVNIDSNNKYYYNNNIQKNNINNNQIYSNISRLKIPFENNIKKKNISHNSYLRREIYSNNMNRMNTELNNSNNNIISLPRNSSIIESYSTKNYYSKSNSNNSINKNIHNYSSHNNLNYANLKIQGGNLSSSYQVTEVPVSFNRTITNIESFSKRFTNNKYAYLLNHKNTHK